MDTGRENVNNTRVTGDFFSHDKTKYSIHSLAKVVDGKYKSGWILIAISSVGK